MSKYCVAAYASIPKNIKPEIKRKFRITFPNVKLIANVEFKFNTLDTILPRVYPDRVIIITGITVRAGFATSDIPFINIIYDLTAFL